jgi:hypothetical protein
MMKTINESELATRRMIGKRDLNQKRSKSHTCSWGIHPKLSLGTPSSFAGLILAIVAST